MANGDMFLSVDGQRTGAIKGGSIDTKRTGEIDVLGFSWGMKAPSSVGGTSAKGRRTLLELRISKGVDSASTALMSVLSTNELIKRAVLTVRKAGGEQIDFFSITIERGRLTSIEVGAQGDPEITEELSFAFEKIEVQYFGQDAKGGRKGGSSFMDEVTSA
jgi:type VI secretion system secreted protein Hcp